VDSEGPSPITVTCENGIVHRIRQAHDPSVIAWLTQYLGEYVMGGTLCGLFPNALMRVGRESVTCFECLSLTLPEEPWVAKVQRP
jgi:hypothetical protein